MIVRSMKGRLFIVLAAATGVIWLCASAWVFFQTRSEVEHVLDTRLQEAARMVSSLAVDGDAVVSGQPRSDAKPLPEIASYERQLSCQIWSLDGRLVGRSRGAPNDSLGNQADGFSDQQVDGETWRVYAISDSAKGIRVLVGDRLGLRERLVSDLIKGLLWPAMLIVPLLGLLIWLILGRGLRPLQLMATDLKSRRVDDMHPVDTSQTPPELTPLATSLNSLFSKVETARQHEREVTAFAAHELRTPLAGLKTQAQVAIATQDPDARARALRNIVISVDRTSRLVRQLLAIARIDAQDDVQQKDEINLGQLLDEIISAETTAEPAKVVLDPALYKISLMTNRDLLTVALRNLHENAVQHIQKDGRVSWSASCEKTDVNITVDDDGPGIPDTEMPLVTTRFFRGRHKSPYGSGLGLSIVQLAVEKLGATLALNNKIDGNGLRATLALPHRAAAQRDAASPSAAKTHQTAEDKRLA
jgi:two-component system sensor histidine kinase QseC